MRPHRSSRIACVAALLLPLGAAACQSGVDLFPVYPLYRDVGDEREGEVAVLWPLAETSWNEDEQKGRSWIFPFYLHWEDEKAGVEGTLVPMVPPLYVHQVRPGFSGRWIFPLYGRTTEGTLETQTWLLFLVERARFEGEAGLVGLSVFPLFRWKEQGPGQALGLLRFGEFTGMYPLFSLVDVDTTSLALHPDEDRVATTVDVLTAGGGLVQLFHTDDAGSHDDTRVLTLFGMEPVALFQRRVPHPGAPGADGGRTIAFPLYWDFEEGPRRTRFFWPLYGSTVDGGNTTMRSFLFPLTRFLDDDRGTSGFDVLFPLIGRRESATSRHSWFFPLFDRRVEEHGETFHVLAWMFGRERRGDEVTWRVFWIPF